MPIIASDLVIYNSVNMPDTDVGVAGGAIYTLRRPDFTQLAANDDIEAVSSNAGDTTQTLTIEGRDLAGNVVSETKTLTGTTPIIFSVIGVIERVLKAELSATTTGSITIRRSPAGATLRIVPAGERGFTMFARKASSDPVAVRNYYSKVFVKNAHATLSLQNTTFRQNADPDARITHLPATTADDTATSTTRQTAPATSATLDPDTFDDTDKTVGALAAGSAWAVWLRMQLPAADPAHRTTYTLEVLGQSV
jgi:hypothetical protein